MTEPTSSTPKVMFTVVGTYALHYVEAPRWPDGWPVPHEGEQVVLRCTAEEEEHTLFVRYVIWCPDHRSDHDGEPDPHVYVVAGERRLD